MNDANDGLDQQPSTPMTREDRIRAAAYRRFSDTGGGGDEVTDWLEAEAEIDAEDAE